MRGDEMLVYKITNKTNSKIYIGQTSRDLKTRLSEHSRRTRTIMGKAIKKYGIDNFEVEQIDDAETMEELNNKEIYWIEHYNCLTPNGYNQCIGGDNTKGFNHRESSKLKMSKSHIALNKVGANNPFYGKTHTPEQIKKWKQDRKGVDLTKASEASILSRQVKVINLDTMEVFDSATIAAKKYDLKATHITRVCRKRRKQTGGFRWIYYDEHMTIPCQAKE